jgi:hypothetical protein
MVVVNVYAPLGDVQSATAQSSGFKSIEKAASFKFTASSLYIRQLACSGPKDLRSGSTFASLRASILSRERNIGNV